MRYTTVARSWGLLVLTLFVALHGVETAWGAEKKKSENLRIPRDLDLKKADTLRGLIDDFRRAEEVSASGKPMIDLAKRFKQAAKKIDIPLTHFYLGRAYQYLRQVEPSIEAFDACLAGNPKFYEAHTHRAQVLYRKHDFEGALKGFVSAIELAPEHAIAFDGASRSALRIGKLEEAMKFAQKADELEQDDDRTDYIKQLDAFIVGPGWDTTQTAESDHFILKTDLSEKRAKRYIDEAEAAHRLFCRYYPIIKKRFGDSKLTIMLYGSQEGYRQSGAFGPDDGYYSPLFRQLNVHESKRSDGVVDALKGQGFFQHAYHLADEVPAWFLQGHRLYFRPALLELVDDRELWIRPPQGTFRSSIATIQRGRLKPLRSLMIMDQEEFESDGDHLHQSWCIIFYCLQGGASKYKKTLLKYFESLADGKSPTQAFDRTFGKLKEKRFVDDMKKYICDKLPKLLSG